MKRKIHQLLRAKSKGRIADTLTDIGWHLDFVFDPVRDKDELPVVRAQTQTQTQTRTRTQKDRRVRTMSDGKDYLWTEDIDERTGTGTITLDSTAVHVHTDRVAETTSYDLQVFNKFQRLDDYKFFNIRHYELIKKVAWSKGIGYRKAAKISAIKNLDGCGERRLADYYKAMNKAHNLARN